MLVYERTLPATARSVSQLRHGAQDALGRYRPDPQVAEQVALALSEAIANVVVHAYRDRGQPGPVRAAVRLHGRCLEVRVGDDGCGIAPRPDSPGLGLGLALMGCLSRRLDIQALDRGGTEVRMRFDLDHPQKTADTTAMALAAT